MSAQSGFTLWTTLIPEDRSAIHQGFTVETHSGDIYATQDLEGRELLITRHVLVDGTYRAVETMNVPGGGHGDLCFDVEQLDGDICPSWLDPKGRLRRMPFRPGNQSLNQAKILATGRLPIRGYDGTVLVRRTVDGQERPHHFYGPGKLGRGQGTVTALRMATKRYFRQRRYGWCQGYAFWRSGDSGRLFTLYGTPYTPKGPLYPGQDIPARIEVREAIKDPAGEILDRIPIDQLGRDDNGRPIDGKLEPEGMCVALVGGEPNLLVGISTGTHAHSNYSLQIWRRPL